MTLKKKSLEQSDDPTPTLTAAVKALRLALGDTQQQFAQRLGLAISTVVRYESTRAPRGKALANLYKQAVNNGLHQIATKFHQAVIIELGAVASYRLTEVEEALLFAVRYLKYGAGTKSACLPKLEAALRIVEEINPFTSAPSSGDEQEKADAE